MLKGSVLCTTFAGHHSYLHCKSAMATPCSGDIIPCHSSPCSVSTFFPSPLLHDSLWTLGDFVLVLETWSCSIRAGLKVCKILNSRSLGLYLACVRILNCIIINPGLCIIGAGTQCLGEASEHSTKWATISFELINGNIFATDKW